MLKKKLSKKGVDEKIATILLVGFVIALIIIGFFWGKQLIKQRVSKEITLSEKKLECDGISITVKEAVQTVNTILIVAENKKDFKIEKITFKVLGSGEEKSLDSFDALNSLEIKRYEVNIADTGISEAESVTLIPWTKAAKSNYVPCTQQGVTAKVTQQEQ